MLLTIDDLFSACERLYSHSPAEILRRIIFNGISTESEMPEKTVTRRTSAAYGEFGDGFVAAPRLTR